MNNKVVYIHYTLKGTPFYVGSGTSKRPYSTRNRNRWWHNIVNKEGLIIKITHTDLDIETSIFWELFFVKWLGRRDLKEGNLVNLCDPSISGMNNPSEETRKKISLINKGRKQSPARIELTRLKMLGNKYHLGLKHMPEAKKKMSNALKGKPNGKLGLPGTNLGKIFSDKHKQKISKAHKGKILTKETRERMSTAFKGRVPWNKGLISHNAKPVLQILNNQIIAEYTSSYTAAKAVKGSASAINAVCQPHNTKNKSHKGFQWKFKD